jgi:hypothetical protein
MTQGKLLRDEREKWEFCKEGSEKNKFMEARKYGDKKCQEKVKEKFD